MVILFIMQGGENMQTKLSHEKMGDLLGNYRVSYGEKEVGQSEFSQDEMFNTSKVFWRSDKNNASD